MYSLVIERTSRKLFAAGGKKSSSYRAPGKLFATVQPTRALERGSVLAARAAVLLGQMISACGSRSCFVGADEQCLRLAQLRVCLLHKLVTRIHYTNLLARRSEQCAFNSCWFCTHASTFFETFWSAASEKTQVFPVPDCDCTITSLPIW